MSDERARSYWAWGYEDRLPEREALRQQVGGLLGVEIGAASSAPPLDQVRVPDPPVEVPDRLRSFCSTDRAERVRRTYGKAFRDQVRAFRGDFAAAPAAVARPRGKVEVAAVLAWAEEAGLAVIPFGGGTSVVGGVEASVGGKPAVSLDLGAMDRVLEVDASSRTARIEAGAKGPALESQLAAHGFTLRHYPQSFEFSTLGGWIATRAGGHFATLYTHIDDLVQSIRMVTPRGVMETPRVPASGAGPCPNRLILGSEGILGVITEARVRIQPRPRYRESASVRFDDLPGAARAAQAVAQSGLFPSNCRVLDPLEALINLVPADGGAVLLLGFESADHAPSARLDRAIALAESHGGKLTRPPTRRDDGPGVLARGGDAAAESWRQSFFEGPYRQSALISLGVLADTFETCCTWSAFPALHAALHEAAQGAFARLGARGVMSCRFTHVYPDGPAPYYTFVAAGMRADLLDAWAEVKRSVSDALRAHGATITHHHAVGKFHRPWYDHERPDLFAEALRGAKRALDPAAVLNPGVLID